MRMHKRQPKGRRPAKVALQTRMAALPWWQCGIFYEIAPISFQDSGGDSYYHGLFVAVRRRFEQGLDFGFSYTFSKPGTYSYFCSIHPKMVAKVIVEAAK